MGTTLRILSLIAITAASVYAWALSNTESPVRKLESYDIIMVDTGTSSQLRGILNIDPSPCIYQPQDLCVHGEQMVLALQSTLVQVEATPVDVLQIPWSNSENLAKGILLASKLGPRIISLSVAGDFPDSREKNAIGYATSKGILVLAASGNEYGKKKSYPASYNFDCLISVSTTDKGVLPKTANPGEIYIPKGPNDYGTSYSTAKAAAIAARYFQLKPQASCRDAKAFLIRVFGHL